MTPTPYTLKSSVLAALSRRYAEQRGYLIETAMKQNGYPMLDVAGEIEKLDLEIINE